MSLGACLPDLEASGQLDPKRAAEARALYEELLAQHARTGSRETAEALASADVLAALEKQVTRKTFLSALAAKRRVAIAADLKTYGTTTGDSRFKARDPGGPTPPQALAALIDHDPRARYSNVEGRRKVIVGAAHSHMDGILVQHSADLLGRVRDKAELDQIGEELFDGATGNRSAKDSADAWRRTVEMLRQRANRAGMDIGFRSDWGAPQSHDWKKVRAAGFEEWKAKSLPRFAPERMIDQRTGKAFTPEKLEAAMRDLFETIRTDGANTMTPGAAGKRALANKRGDARFFVFKSYADWKAYNAEFGSGTLYDAMMGHIESMARDIAALEILGPNPEATLRWAKDLVGQEARLDLSPGSEAIEAADSAGRQLDRLWDEYRGANLVADDKKLALVFSAIRSFEVAIKLGGAFFSAVSDFAFQGMRRSFNGLGQASVLPQYLKLMRPGSIEDQKLAIRRGLIAEEYANRTAAQSRYLMEELSGEFARRLASGVLRLSLLARHTQAVRWVYGMESLATYTEAAGKGYDALHPKLRGALARYGIDAGGWDKLRAAEMDLDRGVEWISPHNLPEADQEIGSRFMQMILEETDLAVPVADLATRALFNSKLERGTWLGETVRSAVLFKSFGVSVLIRQGGEILAMQPGTAARYAGGLVVTTTLAGAAAIQLKELGAGRDPRPMTDERFWGAALLQGGGFGIFGDFLNAAQNRAGGSFAQTMAGPVVTDLQGLVNVAMAEDPRKPLVREIKGLIPGNNLWYARTAFDRMVADQIEEAINPDYRKSRARLERWAAEQGTDYWWPPGDDFAEARAPDWGNAFESEMENEQ